MGHHAADKRARHLVNHSGSTPDFYQGWPYPVTSVNELILTRCPNYVLPSWFKVRDTMLIDSEDMSFLFVFDVTVTVTVFGGRIPHSIASSFIGNRLGDHLNVPQL